ncbi:MAG: hypothetical protein AAGJ08_27405 [Cyanobacteria bacterium P01_H01_bin.35]
MTNKNRKNITQENMHSYDYKNQIIITEKGEEIVDVVVGERGSESDINLLNKQ